MNLYNLTSLYKSVLMMMKTSRRPAQAEPLDARPDGNMDVGLVHCHHRRQE